MRPRVIADEIDVLPAEWRQVGQITGSRMAPLIAQVIDGTLQVDGSHRSGHGFRRAGLRIPRGEAHFAARPY